MSHFKNLRDVCIKFEEDLKNDSPQIFCARIGQSLDDEIVNKMQDLSLFSAKLRLLQAKYISVGPDHPEPSSEEMTMAGYEDTALTKVLEQKMVKSISQFHDVRQLITTPDSKLDPVMIEKKEELISKLKEYQQKEGLLRAGEVPLAKEEEEHSVLRAQWDEELGALRDLSAQANSEEELALEGPLYNKLQALIQKMEMMRWLTSRLVTAQSNYDWLADPDNRLKALKSARGSNSVQDYTGM